MLYEQQSSGCGWLAAMVLWLGACTSLSPSDAGRTPGPAAERASPRVPARAIRVGEDLYQVPIGSDRDGCAMYRLYSPTLVVTQAIWYRAADGRFTLDKSLADCRATEPAG